MLMLMATWSKKILVLGWAPPDKEDVVEHVDVDGDLVQEDHSTPIIDKICKQNCFNLFKAAPPKLILGFLLYFHLRMR